MRTYNQVDVIVIGAGPAGIGVSVLLQKLELDFIILEKDRIGSSFRQWPRETKFISPSFSGNFFKVPDLNAITPDTSPALTLAKEHPTGSDYVTYLENVSRFHNLPIEEGVLVESVEKHENTFTLNCGEGIYQCNYLIWAAGEYQYPRKSSFPGSELCRHYSEIDSFSDLKGDHQIIIGAFESGFDAALNLIKAGKKVTIFDESNYLEIKKSDSSYCLSPFTRERIHEVEDQLDYHSATLVIHVEFKNGNYLIRTLAGETFMSAQQPINCTGFVSSINLIEDFFTVKEGYPLLNDQDESRKTKNLFLVGPQVKHKNALFCFIYKYRQRFAIVAESIARRKKVSRRTIKNVLKEYQDLNFYLKDLSCCDGECVC